MMYDILTIARKELKEIFVQRGSLRSGISNLLIVIAITGILFPAQWGKQWLTAPVGLATAIWLPLFMAMGLVADAFAGERERHTLETLLASRLSDASILIGKVGAAVSYSMMITVASLLVGAITVNVQSPGAGFYSPGLLLGALALSLLAALLVSGIGVLVSLHASNVRQAYQRMSLGFMVIWLPLILGPQLLPDTWKEAISRWAQTVDGRQVALAAGLVLLAIDGLLIVAGLARFQRSRLILD